MNKGEQHGKTCESKKRNTWEVIDNNAVFMNSDHTIVNRDGSRATGTGTGSHRVFYCGDDKPTKNSAWVGTVYLDGSDELMFIPADGVEHTADHLREIADLMDARADKADAAGA
jgi:hypothetical protein